MAIYTQGKQLQNAQGQKQIVWSDADYNTYKNWGFLDAPAQNMNPVNTQSPPVLGGNIPGTNLKYDAADIANLNYGGQTSPSGNSKAVTDFYTPAPAVTTANAAKTQYNSDINNLNKAESYLQYAGSPDIFNSQGVYQPTMPSGNIQQVNTARPDAQTGADIGRLNGTNILNFQTGNPATDQKIKAINDTLNNGSSTGQYFQYAGSPDIFDSNGVYQSSMPSGNITQVNTPRPDIKTEADFATKNGTNIQRMGSSSVSSANDKVNAAIEAARTAKDNEDPLGLKQAMADLKVYQKERQDAINKLYEQQTPLRDAYIKSLTPGANEMSLQTQLADIRAGIDQTSLNAQAGINKVSNQAIPQGFVTGQNKAIANAANLTLQTQAAQEKNLLSRLGIEAGNREAMSKGLEAGLSFLGEDIKAQMLAQDRLDNQEQNFIAQFDKYTTQQKQDAADILTSLAGVDPATLSPETLTKLAQIAQQRGIGLQDLLSGLSLQHDQLILENAVKTQNAMPTANEQYGTGSIGEYNFAVANGYKGTYSDYQDEDANRKIAINKSGVAGTNVQTDNERALMSQFRGEQIVKDFNLVATQKSSIDNYIQNGTGGPADLAMIFTFMKALDPSSVVRESEYETASKSGNIFQGMWAKFNGYFKDQGGILPDNVKSEFKNLINQKFKAQEKLYSNVAQQYTDISNRQRLDPRNVVIDYGEAMKPKTVEEYIQNNPGDLDKINKMIDDGKSDEEIMQILGG